MSPMAWYRAEPTLGTWLGPLITAASMAAQKAAEIAMAKRAAAEADRRARHAANAALIQQQQIQQYAQQQAAKQQAAYVAPTPVWLQPLASGVAALLLLRTLKVI